MTSPLRIGVLASHEGTTLQAILDACAAGEITARVVTVISNNSDSGALRRARAAAADALHLSSKTHPAPGELDAAITAALVARQVDVLGVRPSAVALQVGIARQSPAPVGPGAVQRDAGMGRIAARVAGERHQHDVAEADE